MLEGSLVRLREPRPEDLDLLGSLRNDVELQLELMATPRPNTLERVRQWIDARLNDPRSVLFVVADRASDRACGFVQLKELDPLHGHAELGVCLAPSARGTGHAGEALALLEGYARDVFRIRKLILHVLVSNERATAFYAKTGFREVGVLREHFYHHQCWHDVAIMERFLDRDGGPQPGDRPGTAPGP